MTTNKKPIKPKARPVVFSLVTIAFIVSLSLSSPIFLAKSQIADASSLFDTPSIESKPQFRIDIVYAYVGPRRAHFTMPNPIEDSPVSMLNALSLHPSIVYFNVTPTSDSETMSCDAKIEVYIVTIFSDKGSVENFTYFEGKNCRPSFSNPTALAALSSHINKLVGSSNTLGLRGFFDFNRTVGQPIIGDRVGSFGIYTSRPSRLGLWQAGQPNAIYVYVRRVGWVMLKDGTVSTTLANDDSMLQVELSKSGNGFMYNTIVPQDKVQQMDPWHPPI
jgi:hypothetical protein